MGWCPEEELMMTHSHLTSLDRSLIQQRLNEEESFRSIGRELGKDPTTIAKEVKVHIQFKQSGCYGMPYNNCLNRNQCPAQQLCGNKSCKRYCRFCNSHSCASHCSAYQAETCTKLAKPPYVCNGCDTKKRCTLEKRIYAASNAQKEYEVTRSEARQGLQIDELEALRLDAVISPLLHQGQSLHHICIAHADEIMLHERTLYRYVDSGIFTARNIDMPRVVRMGRRKRKRDAFKVDRACRENRTYLDYKKFMAEHPDLPVVEIDSVEGTKGGKVLLTIHFVSAQLMLAFLRDANTSQSVIDIFDQLYEELGPETFCRLFAVLLGDNGSEFSNPVALEQNRHGVPRARVFYCDPQAPYQKGAIENNHTLIRRIIPKGTPLDGFTQQDICKVMNHINSYGRKNLGDMTPYAVFSAFYGEDVLKGMGVEFVPSDLVTLHPSLLKK